jgi:large subunit ribosomal protein L9
MKIILRKEHEKLGQVGTLVDVKDGYARNYLIPRGIAFPADASHLRALEEEKRQHERRATRELHASQKLAEELEKISITLKMKVGEDEKLFGSVTSQMIGEALEEKGVALDKRAIELEEPIKALGIYSVPIRLHQAVTATVKVWVVRE